MTKLKTAIQILNYYKIKSEKALFDIAHTDPEELAMKNGTIASIEASRDGLGSVDRYEKYNRETMLSCTEALRILENN